MERTIETQTKVGEVAIYNPDDSIRLEVRLEQETVWLDRTQLSILFDRDKKTIAKHINTALEEELKGIPTVAKFEIVQQEGDRRVKRHKEFFNLDMILSVGYRVYSFSGNQATGLSPAPRRKNRSKSVHDPHHPTSRTEKWPISRPRHRQKGTQKGSRFGCLFVVPAGHDPATP